jgi:predicted metal-dependent peptidase
MSDVGERVRRARLQLMLRHPFLAGATARLPLVEVEPDGWCGTAATDGFRIYWSAAFFASLDDEQIAGVLAHEILHAVLGHCERRGAREAERWNVAIDHATNLLVRDELDLRLPEPHLAYENFRHMTAEAIYDALGGPAATSAVVPDAAPPAPRPVIGAARRRAAERRAAEAAAARQAATRDVRVRLPRPLNKGFDIHLDHDDPRRALAPGNEDPTPLELSRLRRELQIELRDGLRDGRGVMSSEVDEAILRAGRAHTPWQALLARCFTGIRRDDYRFLPPSRRHVWRGMMLPSVGVPGPNNVVCAIDTSGSIERPLAARFLAEVHALRCNARCRLHVLQCDDAITDRRVYESWEQPPPAAMPETFKGRGGTDFRPVFDLVATDISRPEGWPDLLAYLTDGQGSFPERAPPYPVVWLLPEGSRVVPPFGARIEIPAA